MDTFVIILIVASITGAGLVSGLLFAFSNFVMRVLADLPADEGMLVMQRINATIINPVFIAIFFGTPLLCLIVAILSARDLDAPGSWLLLTGSLAYLIGPYGITVLFNVPLNNQLAGTDASDADKIWPMYQNKWQRWNHIRTYIGVASIILMSLGLNAR